MTRYIPGISKEKVYTWYIPGICHEKTFWGFQMATVTASLRGGKNLNFKLLWPRRRARSYDIL
jgi:hypothetical protein